jgi:hypothetical protein
MRRISRTALPVELGFAAAGGADEVEVSFMGGPLRKG